MDTYKSTSEQTNHPPHTHSEHEDSEKNEAMVCFCYKMRHSDLIAAHQKYGSLREMEKHTKVGTGCSGCKVLLHSIFNETPSEIGELANPQIKGTTCVKPGQRTMKGFVIADGSLESTIYSANAVAPQLGTCDSTIDVRYTLVDHTGQVVLSRTGKVRTNETFVFETRKEKFPRPFHGLFLYEMSRSNYGASRFNVYWSNGKSATATHENAGTGRPKVFLPLIVDQAFAHGPNTIYFALTNPYEATIPFEIVARDIVTGKTLTWTSNLGPLCSSWIDAQEYLYTPALSQIPKGRISIQIRNTTMDMHKALSVYFFIHNRATDVWTANHL